MRITALLVALFFTASVQAVNLPNQPHVYVEGNAELKIKPDTVKFQLRIEDMQLESIRAKATVDQRSNTLIALCKKLKVAKEDISTTSLDIRPEYRYDRGERSYAGTRVSRDITITLRSLEKYPEVIAALFESKVSETLNTQLLVSDEKKQRDVVLQKATEDAKQRAESLAKVQGVKLGGVYSVSQFSDAQPIVHQEFNALNSYAKMSRDAGPEPFEPGMISLEARIYVVYLLGGAN